MSQPSLATIAALVGLSSLLAPRARCMQSGDGPYDVFSREFTFHVPRPQPPGEDEPLDVFSREVTFRSPTADLAFDVAALQLPSEGSVDQVFELRFRVRNVGSVEAVAPWIDRLQFSTSIRPVGGSPSSTFDFPSATNLAPDASYERVAQFLMPSLPGSFTITLTTDALGNVIEVPSELDNVFGPQAVTVIDIARPNLNALVTVQPAPMPTAGEFVTLSFSVWNDGEAPTSVPQWIDRVYLVPDAGADGIPPANTSGSIAGFAFPNLSFLQNEPGGDGSTPGTSYVRMDATGQLPLTAPAGPYFLGVRTDADNAQIELDESDNLAWSSVFMVLEPLRPDLGVSAVALQGVVPGTPIQSGTHQTVQWTVTNSGPATFSGGAVAVQVWVSTDAGTDAGAFDDALLLESFADVLPALGVDASSARSRQVFVPPDLPLELPSSGGPYFFKVLVDSDGQVPEQETQGAAPYWNNLAASGDFPVSLSATPDLVASAIGPAPGQGTPEAAHPLQVSFTVENPEAPGWDVPLSWNDQILLSAGNATLGPEDVPLGSFGESTVQQGGEWVVPPSYAKTVTVTLPADTEAGLYHLILVIDESNAVFEFSGSGDANNELASAAFLVESHPADLALVPHAGGGSVLPSSAGAAGQTITLPWTVTNGASSGATSVSTWTDRVLLSPSPTSLVGAVTVLSHAQHGALAPGDSYEAIRTASVPFVDASADWWLHFGTDVSGAVFEGGATANNSAAVPFDVTPELADLVVDWLSATPRVRPGEPLIASWHVRNSGSAPTGSSSWTDSVYLEQAGALFLLGSVGRNGALNAGSFYDASSSFALPSNLPSGAWYVIVRVDADGAVFESDEANNDRATRSVFEIEPLPPANLAAHGVAILNGPVTAGQEVALAWQVENSGDGPTDVSRWTDSVYLSLDGALDASDALLGIYQHTQLLAAGEVRAVPADFIVPLWANGAWVVIVETNSDGAVEQAGLELDDFAASPGLLQVQAPPLTDLEVVAAGVPASAILGAPLAFDWTTLNGSETAIPAGWSWRDRFWLLPQGEVFPSPAARVLGELESDAALLGGGATHVQSSSSLAVPGVMPGLYRLVVVTDALNQIAELHESDNVFTSSAAVDLQAIPIAAGGMASTELASGASRWFRLSPAADQTIDLELAHDDSDARCELYVRAGEPPSLGNYDFRSEGAGAVDPSVQLARIPRTSGEDYFVLARTVSGAGAASSATLFAHERPFAAAAVEPPAVGAGDVTIAIEGAQLWRATSVELRGASPGAGVEGSLEHVLLEDGTLLARFELAGAELGARTVVVIDATAQVEAAWSGSLAVEAPAPLALEVALEVAPSIRRGETGAATLRLANRGNVDVPYALATMGHARAAGASDPLERVVVSSGALGIEELESDGANDSLAFAVEDLRPGGVHELALALHVGGDFPLDGASFAVACRPATSPAFLSGTFDGLSQSLRAALAADPSTPALLSIVAQDPELWSQVVTSGLVSGSIAVDVATIHTPSSAARTLRELAQAIADGVALELALPPGAMVPASAIDAVASSAGCAPFADSGLECAALFPAECGGAAAQVLLATQDGGNVPAGVACVATPAPDDPNVKVKPNGTGPQAMVNGDAPLRYEVHFENQASATAWASRVLITDVLEPGFRSSSVRFHELRVGRTTIPFPPNTSSFVGQVPLAIDDETDVLCQLSCTVDALTDTIFVLLQALDPETGLPPSSGDEGLLPPSSPATEREATGYVAFSALPDSQAITGGPSVSAYRMKNSADIRFNAQVPIPTNQTENVLDGGPPVSQLFLDSVDGRDVALSWSADDTEALPGGPFPGAGVDRFTLSVTTDGGAHWSALLTDSADTTFLFTGDFGASYGFKVEATDAVGNAESKEAAEVSVDMPADCNGNGVPDDEDIASSASLDTNGNGVPDECECTWSSYCTAASNSTGEAAAISGSGNPSLSVGSFTLSATNVPPFTSAMFLYGSEAAEVPFGNGVRCVGGELTKLRPVMITGAAGTAALELDLQEPQVPLAVGEIGYFQLWFRDAAGGGAGSNLSDGLAVTWCE